MGEEFQQILDGSNDDEALFSAYSHIGASPTPEEALFAEAWELSNFIAANGFEILFGQHRTIMGFADLFKAIGFDDARPVFQKVSELVPDALLEYDNQNALQEHLQANFSQLQALFYEYLDCSDPLMTAFGNFVRTHRDRFSKSQEPKT